MDLKEVPTKAYNEKLKKEVFHCEEDNCVNNSALGSDDESLKNAFCFLKKPSIFSFGKRCICEDKFPWGNREGGK